MGNRRKTARRPIYSNSTAGARRRWVDIPLKIAYGPRVRRANYRLVLPEGPLRRFRLPESFGDEAPRPSESRPLPVSAGLGWVAICGCSWLLARGSVDPLALLDGNWQLPQERVSAFEVAELAAPPSTPAGRVHAPPPSPGPGPAVSHGPAPSPDPAPPTLDARSSAVALPRVSFSTVEVFGGGLGYAGATVSPVEAAPLNERTATSAAIPEPTEAVREREVPSATPGPTLGQVVAGWVADSPRLPSPPAKGPVDPFEADFGAASLPRLSEAAADSAPVALRRNAEPQENGAEGAPRPERAAVTGSEARGVFHWNGGCQRAFQQSVQEVGPSAGQRDATGADYQRVLSKVNLSSCSPQAGSQVEVCVAAEHGRAAGISVHTTPAREPLARCVVRQVRALTFPSSAGMDLVRTSFRVE